MNAAGEKIKRFVHEASSAHSELKPSPADSISVEVLSIRTTRVPPIGSAATTPSSTTAAVSTTQSMVTAPRSQRIIRINCDIQISEAGFDGPGAVGRLYT